MNTNNDNYKILEMHIILPKLITSNIADLVINLASTDTTINFNISKLKDSSILAKFEEYDGSKIMEPEHLDLLRRNDAGFLIGYNQKHQILTLSNPDKATGAIEIIGKKMIYHDNGVKLDNIYDSYLFGSSHLKYYTDKNYEDILQEFLHKKYRLYQGNPDSRFFSPTNQQLHAIHQLHQ